MDLEGIMTSKISQRKTNTEWPHLYVESQKQKTETETKIHRKRDQTSCAGRKSALCPSRPLCYTFLKRLSEKMLSHMQKYQENCPPT